MYSEATDGTGALTQQKEVAGDGSVAITARDLFDLNTALEWLIGFEVTVDGAAKYSLILRNTRVMIAPPPAADIGNPPIPCTATLQLKDERDTPYTLPQNIPNVYELQQAMNETWTLAYNFDPANCDYRVARMELIIE